MMGICMRYAKSSTEAEDVLLMGFTRIYKKIKQFSGQGSFEGWMRRIMVNVAIDNFRKNQKYYYHDDIEDTQGGSMITDEIPDNFTVEEILKTVQKLPPGYRVVFNMFAIEGYSHKEIADKLGVSESTSKTQLLKARKKLQTQLSYLQQPVTHSVKKIRLNKLTGMKPQLSFDGK